MSTATEARIFEFGGFRLDVAQRQLLSSQGAQVDLPSRAFDLLLYVVERPGELLDKSALLKGVWPTTVVEESNLSQCIFALRRALGDTAHEHRFIVTVPGRGYQFVAPVRMGTARGSGKPPPDPGAITSGRTLPRRALLIACAIAACALIGLFAWVLRPHADALASRASPVESNPVPQTIAVLPFDDLSPAHDMEYFTDGMAEELMNSLARTGSLRVIGRGSAFTFKGTNEDARSIGARLNVDSILEGSVRKAGERIRISARLVRTHDGFSLWSGTYDRKLDDVLDLQSAIASEVTAALSPMISPAARPGRSSDEVRTHSPEAYNAYLRGAFLSRQFTSSSYLRACEEYRHAVELDPQFALAHARLAEAYIRLANGSNGNVVENRSLAAASLDRALKLDPQIADLWWVQVWFEDEASQSLTSRAGNLERALKSNPDNGTVILLLADAYLWLGRRAEALELYERGRRVDPLWAPAIFLDSVTNYLYRGNRQRALDLLDEMERLGPGPKPANLRALIALSEGRALDWDHWKAKEVEAEPRDPALHGYLSLEYGHLGILDAALYHARVGHGMNPESADGAYNTAHIYLFSGNVEAARPWVRKAVAERPGDFLAQFAQAELQYFTGDCGGAIRSLELARPGYRLPPGSFALVWNPEQVVILIWCLRQQRESTRAEDFARALTLQLSPPITAGVRDGLQARIAAAVGDRDALVQHLQVLVDTKSMAFAFARHEPMIQPYLHDPQVKALLGTLDARRTEWRRILPKSSMRVPIPGVDAAK